MRTLLLLATLALAGTVRANQPVDVCAEAETGAQQAMNLCEAQKLTQAEADMAAVLAQIAGEYADEPLFLEKLRIAQSRWKDWVDAEMEAKYPVAEGQDPLFEYGSVYPMAWSQHRAELVRQRTMQLQVWIDGIPEGDVAAGSVHTKEE